MFYCRKCADRYHWPFEGKPTEWGSVRHLNCQVCGGDRSYCVETHVAELAPPGSLTADQLSKAMYNAVQLFESSLQVKFDFYRERVIEHARYVAEIRAREESGFPTPKNKAVAERIEHLFTLVRLAHTEWVQAFVAYQAVYTSAYPPTGGRVVHTPVAEAIGPSSAVPAVAAPVPPSPPIISGDGSVSIEFGEWLP